jgi:uncharacterized protein (DUF433 family)
MSTKLKIRAGDAVNDIRAGMTDSEMMEKYGLSAKGLHRLFSKLLDIEAITQSEMERRSACYHDTIVIRQLDSGNMVDDLRSGMSDSELMNKYGLSAEGLRRAFQGMIDAKVITIDDLYATSPSHYDTVFVENMREVPRYHLAVEVVIYELRHPQIKGQLINIGEKGIGIKGIEARIGETKTFIIPTGAFSLAFSPLDPVRFDANCVWARKEPITGQWYSGFEIAYISKKCWDDLERLLQSASFVEK